MTGCTSAGGTLRLTIGGTVYSVRGSVTIMPTKFEINDGANLDGTVFTTYKPQPAKMEMTVSHAEGLSINALFAEQCTDATVVLDAVGTTFVFVNASVTGRPSLDPETGEISGLSMVASDVRELTGQASLVI